MFNVSVNDKKNIYRSKPVMNVDTVPKPLTYDYMPEGYPSKSMGLVTLMEEQEVTFSDLGGGQMMAQSPVKLELGANPIKLGDKLTVVWDGVSYDVIVKDAGEGILGFGNLSISNPSLEATDDPFLYTYGLWVTSDAATSHAIGVAGPQAVYTTMDANFIPIATENTYGAVKTSDFIKMVTLDGKMDKETVYKYAKEFEDGKIRLRLVIDENRIHDISSIGKYGKTGAGEVFTVYTEEAPYCGKQFTCGSDGQYDFSLWPSTKYTSSVAYLQDIWLHSNDETNNTSAKITVSAKGKWAEGMFLDIGCEGIIVNSSTSGSLKKFKITVDDSGTISATEVT